MKRIVSSELWNSEASTLVRRYGDMTRQQFNLWRAVDSRIRVAIPSYNGADDLPRTLASLAGSVTPLEVMVVTNGCAADDKTSSIAERMGARVQELKQAGKMGATQVALSTYISEGVSEVLLTDDDTLLPPKWAGIMTRRLRQLRESNEAGPAAVCGSAFYVQGSRKWLDILRSAHDLALDAKKNVLGKTPIARGFNMGLGFDGAGKLYDAIQDMPADLFPREDTAMRDAVIENDGVVSDCLNLGAIALTRNDRVSTWNEFRLMRSGHAVSLYREYTPGVPYHSETA